MHSAVEHQYQADQAANMVRGRGSGGSGGSGGFKKLLQGLGSGYQNATCPEKDCLILKSSMHYWSNARILIADLELIACSD